MKSNDSPSGGSSTKAAQESLQDNLDGTVAPTQQIWTVTPSILWEAVLLSDELQVGNWEEKTFGLMLQHAGSCDHEKDHDKMSTMMTMTIIS